MKKIISGLAIIAFYSAFTAKADTVQYITLTAPNTLAVQTNQIISLVGFDWVHCYFIDNTSEGVAAKLANGAQIVLTPYSSGFWSGASSQNAISAQIPQVVTGVTNIFLYGSVNWATLKIETPVATAPVSNYIPADAIVIPASVTGNVQIILESSPDLVNWTASNPGTYGASAATNRFFRVRAAVNP